MQIRKIQVFSGVCAAAFGLAAGPVWAQVTAPVCVPGTTVSKTLVDFGAGSDPSLRATNLAASEGEPNVMPNGTFSGYAFSSTPNSAINGVYYIGNSSGAASIPGAPADVKDRNFDALAHPAGNAGNMLIVDPPTGVTLGTGSSLPVLRLRINGMTPGAQFRFSVSARPLGANAQFSMHMVTPTSTGAASITYAPASLPMGAWTEASLVPGSMLTAQSDWVEVALRTPVAAAAHGGPIAFDDLRLEIECPPYTPPQVTFDAIASQAANLPLQVRGWLIGSHPSDAAFVSIYTLDGVFYDRVEGPATVAIDPATGQFSITYPPNTLPAGSYWARLRVQGAAGGPNDGMDAQYVSAPFTVTAAAVAGSGVTAVPASSAWGLGLLGAMLAGLALHRRRA